MALERVSARGWPRGLITDTPSPDSLSVLHNAVLLADDVVARRGPRLRKLQCTVPATIKRVFGNGMAGTVTAPYGAQLLSLSSSLTSTATADFTLAGRSGSSTSFVDLGSGLKDAAGTVLTGCAWKRIDRFAPVRDELIGSGGGSEWYEYQARPRWCGSKKADYATGTVSTAATGRTVTGNLTSWLANVEPGMFLYIDHAGTALNERCFRITAVNSDTSLEVDAAPGVLQAGMSYRISAVGRISAPDNVFAFNGASCNWVAARVLTGHQNRVFAAATQEIDNGVVSEHLHRIRWSALPNEAASGKFYWMDRWEEGGHADVYPGQGGSQIVGLASLGNQLVILKDGGIFALNGYVSTTGDLTLTQASISVVSMGIGCLGSNAYDVCPAGVVFASTRGIFLYDGAGLTNLTEGKIGRMFDRNLDAPRKDCVVSAVRDRVFIGWSGDYMPSSGGPIAFTHLVFEVSRQRWSTTGLVTKGIADQSETVPPPRIVWDEYNQWELAPWAHSTDDVELIDCAGDFEPASTTIGLMDLVDGAAGVHYSSHVYTNPLTLGDRQSQARLRHLTAMWGAYPAGGTYTLSLYAASSLDPDRVTQRGPFNVDKATGSEDVQSKVNVDNVPRVSAITIGCDMGPLHHETYIYELGAVFSRVGRRN